MHFFFKTPKIQLFRAPLLYHFLSFFKRTSPQGQFAREALTSLASLHLLNFAYHHSWLHVQTWPERQYAFGLRTYFLPQCPPCVFTLITGTLSSFISVVKELYQYQWLKIEVSKNRSLASNEVIDGIYVWTVHIIMKCPQWEEVVYRRLFRALV